MNKIDAHARSIADLLSNKKYTVDYYQREYKWEAKQVRELLEDLEANFLNDYEEGHARSAVETYKHYFLGSIIVSNRDGKKFIIDGQQRLTSITLLLIYLHNLQQNRPDNEHVDISNLIFSEKYGKKSFNLDIDERATCIEALYNQHAISFDANNEPESIRTILARYDDIERLFPPTLANGVLPYFIDWLKENVDLVEITTFSDEDAYTIFETMNDRGLSLSPTDMLKGYLLANITDTQERAKANDRWKEQMLKLTRAGKEENADFFKAWLRAQYASSIREHKKGGNPGDFDVIGTTFHKWVHDQSRDIGLSNAEDFHGFVTKHMQFFSSQYISIRQAAETLTPGLEYIYYNAHNNFTLQYPLLLAPLRPEEDTDTTQRKIRLVAGYLDILIARRAVNFRTMDYSSIVYTMFNLMKEMRGLDIHSLVRLLKQKVTTMENSFDKGVPWFRSNLWSKRYVHHILARMTHYIETQCGIESSFVAYTSKSIKKPFEIEHIWSNKYSYHQEEFSHKEDFDIHRSRFGGLLLLPRGFNQSFGDKPYSEKLDHYYGQNLLARSLHPLCYKNNPSFLHFIEQSGLPFRPYETFTKKDLDERQHLYQLICEQIWNPSRFDQELQ
ncbi:DUF262 domain-containing protein [Ktedonospora formicarum]|uniref:DUF262 domain-containing protein n=1 Tax=Ktedonospora formicarum TaxID=2778364 RepID=A0A8J3I9E9_9CHLR|nr:DUF262 domain-containing protein [Ktedonospora formicarum]GHO49643.1 hypothetical protein KSX_78060 [Ktedonospora formicarum]